MDGRRRYARSIAAKAIALCVCVCACSFAIAVALFGGVPGDVSGRSISGKSQNPVVELSNSDKFDTWTDAESSLERPANNYVGGESGRRAESLGGSDGTKAEYRPHEALVQLAEDVSAADLTAALEACDFVSTKSISQKDVSLGWAKIDLAPGISVEAAVNALMSLGVVVDAQPNYVYRVLDDVSQEQSTTGGAHDAALVDAQQAQLAIGSQSSPQPWHLQAIGASQAWELLDPQGDVSVAVIDSGCDTNNSGLSTRVLAGSGFNVLTGTSDVLDTYGHGTRVADVVASVLPSAPRDGEGRARNLKVVPIKVMNKGSTDTSNLVKAYDYILKKAKAYNIRVVNMSLGAVEGTISLEDSATLYAIDRAFDAGILSVFAGGNEEGKFPYYCYPCDYSENGLGVINLKRVSESRTPTADNLVRDSSSNYNKPSEKTKSLSAPGTKISASVLTGTYGTVTGTSFACPVVAGVAALVFAENTALTPAEAKSVLFSSADDLAYSAATPPATVGFDDITGYGLVRADKAIRGARDLYVKGAVSLSIGQTATLSVPKAGSWTWSSETPSVVSVDSKSGQIRGLSYGEAVVSATDGVEVIKQTVVVYETAPPSGATAVVGSPVYLGALSVPYAVWSYSPSDPTIATVGANSGIVTGKHVGTIRITAQHSVLPDVRVAYTVTVNKGANPLKVKAKTVKVKASKLRRKTQKVKRTKAFKVQKAKGAVQFKLVKRNSKAGKKIAVSKAGKITVKKGLARGTYKMKVKVTAVGNADYKACAKKVTLKVKVS